jgi:phosphatidylglycerophosphate synthase
VEDVSIADSQYKLWLYVHSSVLLIGTLLVSPIFEIEDMAFLHGLALFSLGSMLVLYTRPKHQRPCLADALTALRGLAAVLIFEWAALSPVFPGLESSNARWLVFALLAGVELTDFFDGMTARRRPHRSFGGVWDMENDALLALALSIVGHLRLGVPIFALLIGLMRYLYFLVFRLTEPPTAGPAYKWFSKTVAALIAVSLIIPFAPIVPPLVNRVLIASVLGLQVISFGWDVALQFQAGRIGSSREIPAGSE